MASTYTPAGIELIADGEQSGTWGQTTNTNWELVEELATGVVSISLTGLTTYTLTTTDGTSTEGRHAVVKFTGSPGGTCTVTVSPNDMQKIYWIVNASDQSVVMTQGSGGNVTVLADSKKVMYCDGAGAGAAVVDLSQDLDIHFMDGDKLTFGDSADLEIYHDGSNSIINDAGTGNLKLQLGGSDKLEVTSAGVAVTGTVDVTSVEATNLKAKDGTTSATIADSTGVMTIASSVLTTTDINGGTVDGITSLTQTNVAADATDVELKYSGSTKLATTSTGIDVTGTVTADEVSGQALRLDRVTSGNNIDINAYNPISTAGIITKIRTDGDSISNTYGALSFHTTRTPDTLLQRMRIASNGDISFYEDTGTTPKFFWDASAESLGIGNTTPQGKLEVSGDVYINGGNQSTAAALVISAGAAGTDGVTLDTSYYGGGYGPLKLKTGGAERMRIDSSGNVGIGTSSPSGNLEIATSAADTGVDLVLDGNKTSNGGIGSIIFNNNGDSVGMIRSNRASANDAADMLFYTQATGGSNTERMRIDSSGNLRVGVGNTFEPTIQFTNSGRVVGNPGYSFNGDLDTGMFNPSTQGTIAFANNGSESMRIDSSGNLLVGKTSSGIATDGIEVDGNLNKVQVTRDGGTPFFLNRKTSDGTIADFRKDGSTVGSIGIESTGFYVDGEAGHTGLKFRGFDIIPRDNGSDVDAGVNLGGTASRFAALYLSGGVYLGGTGAANYLDDYEEGTWTATLTTTGTDFTHTGRDTSGSYTKIGNKVTAWFACVISSPVSGGTGDIIITGLPFTSVSTFSGVSFVNSGRFDLAGTHIYAAVGSNDTTIALKYQLNNSNPGSVSANDINGNATPYITGCVTYQTS